MHTKRVDRRPRLGKKTWLLCVLDVKVNFDAWGVSWKSICFFPATKLRAFVSRTNSHITAYGEEKYLLSAE